MDNEKFKKCVHDIRNMIPLNKQMIQNISNMTHEQKLEIIKIYNNIVISLKEIADV